MEVTGEEVLEWAERKGFILSEWQREMILRADWSKPFELHPLWPEPRKPVLTRRVQRRTQTRAERRRAGKLPQPGHLVIVDELTRQP
jgi:hypothetical protein